LVKEYGRPTIQIISAKSFVEPSESKPSMQMKASLIGLIDKDFKKQLVLNMKFQTPFVKIFKNPLLATVLQVLVARTIEKCFGISMRIG